MRPRLRAVGVAALGVPAEMLLPLAPVWHDRETFVAYMTARGWRLPAPERYGVGNFANSSPENRRRTALACYAREHGHTWPGTGLPDQKWINLVMYGEEYRPRDWTP
ncbi:hypothetical protein F8280_28745 [Micromonospora noduli]|uniref:hypothetical protein n=1 Tax=Micromonospora noduli TaxID=709876 RepID=UPI00124B6630|nr:hypothetical protein [Micromonospora noduli]KAB1917989.1 hypothetical protein F8280_28745 [Micromonospora noduli]